MARPKPLDLLFALAGTSEETPIDPAELLASLERSGLRARPGTLLAMLLQLEHSGHVWLRRAGGYAFAVTPLGEQATLELGPGQAVQVTVVMVDLVGFVAFTEAHGDEAAHRAARQLHDVARAELGQRSGRVVKPLGDGVLGTLPPVRTRPAPWPRSRAAAAGRTAPAGPSGRGPAAAGPSRTPVTCSAPT